MTSKQGKHTPLHTLLTYVRGIAGPEIVGRDVANSLTRLLNAVDYEQERRDEAHEALRGLFKHCAMVHKHWGEGSNQKEADAAIAKAQSILSQLDTKEG